jgi:hypothetical protein
VSGVEQRAVLRRFVPKDRGGSIHAGSDLDRGRQVEFNEE